LLNTPGALHPVAPQWLTSGPPLTQVNAQSAGQRRLLTSQRGPGVPLAVTQGGPQAMPHQRPAPEQLRRAPNAATKSGESRISATEGQNKRRSSCSNEEGMPHRTTQLARAPVVGNDGYGKHGWRPECEVRGSEHRARPRPLELSTHCLGSPGARSCKRLVQRASAMAPVSLAVEQSLAMAWATRGASYGAAAR
jgi:hypothetical protein